MNFSKEIMKGSAEFIVISILHELGEAYGYQMIKAIKETSSDIFKLQESTLYPLLYRLEEKGVIASEIKRAKNGKDRRYYYLSAKGKKLFREKNEEIELYLKGMKKFLHHGVNFKPQT